MVKITEMNSAFLTSTGDIYVVGYDVYGQMGLGYSYEYIKYPVLVDIQTLGGEKVKGVSAGDYHTLVVTGAVWNST